MHCVTDNAGRAFSVEKTGSCFCGTTQVLVRRGRPDQAARLTGRLFQKAVQSNVYCLVLIGMVCHRVSSQRFTDRQLGENGFKVCGISGIQIPTHRDPVPTTEDAKEPHNRKDAGHGSCCKNGSQLDCLMG
jgi:hypothetical protein